MFLFYHSEQEPKNAKYYKGKLFEAVLARYLKKVGYTVEIRCKHNSLEYDLEGVNDTTGQKIIGEAKAHETTIDGATVSSFVGKLLPLGLLTKDVFGLFLSTSAITAEAEDYVGKVKDLGLRIISGKNMYDTLVQVLNMPKEEKIERIVIEKGYQPLFYHLLTTDMGDFIVAICGGNGTVAASAFMVIDKNEKIIDDVVFLEKLTQNVKELGSLNYILNENTETRECMMRTIPKGISYGRTWTDYRLPAAPTYYVGRKELIEQIIGYIDGNREAKVIQIKSRSGVGKSSTLALLANKLEDKNYNVEIHDVRDIKSILDVYSIIYRFTGVDKMPQDFLEVEEAIKELAQNGKTNILIVDQFESTFFRPDIFQAYEDIATIISKLGSNIYFCLARKNDQITTYDNTFISLQRLNALSQNYELRDFSIEESKLLLERINENADKKIGIDVLAYVLEFAQGFPWLLKRTMAHIIKLTNVDNISQKNLFNTGLMLSDLFEEELEGLEEYEKEYIVRIASKLPADYHELQRCFDEDPLLPKMLDKFTEMRLLRLSGSTYDTYNDVFKEYLVYKKLPEFRHQYLFRQAVNPVINFFGKIVYKNKFTLEQLSTSQKTSQKTMGNYLKECRNLNLVRREDEYWEVPSNVKEIYSQGLLGEYIRRQVLANDLVSNFITYISKNSVTSAELPYYLQKQFPFVEASDSTWQLYANLFEVWILSTKIAFYEDNVIKHYSSYNEKDVKELGNLQKVQYGRRSHTEILLPSASWTYVEEFYKVRDKSGDELKGEVKKVYLDFKRVGALSKLEKIESYEEYKKYIIETYLLIPEYKKIWVAAEKGVGIKKAVAEIAGSEITESTLEWRTKRIINWGKGAGIIAKKRYTYDEKEIAQMSLFDIV